MPLFFVNCERTVSFSVKRDLDPPLYHPLLLAPIGKQNVWFVFQSSFNFSLATITYEEPMNIAIEILLVFLINKLTLRVRFVQYNVSF